MQLHRAVALQQAKTLVEWAEVWERAARLDRVEGAEDAAMLLKRAARQIRVALGDAQPEAAPEPEKREAIVDELREG